MIRRSWGSAYTSPSRGIAPSWSTSRTVLHWLSRDSVHGEKEGEDRYHAQHIEPHVFFVNWVEADGTTISQVLDLKARTCQAFINSNVYARNRRGRETVILSGRITKVEDATHVLLE